MWLCFSGGSVVKNQPEIGGDTGSISKSERFPGEWNGNLLQYSCLGNPMDWGAWQVIVHGIPKSQPHLWLNNNNPYDYFTATSIHSLSGSLLFSFLVCMLDSLATFHYYIGLAKILFGFYRKRVWKTWLGSLASQCTSWSYRLNLLCLLFHLLVPSATVDIQCFLS